MLHIVNRSPFERSALQSCLRVLRPGARLLLIEDGVYAAAGHPLLPQAIERMGKDLCVYALGPDLDARALRERAFGGVSIVDYAGFVDLVTASECVQSWL